MESAFRRASAPEPTKASKPKKVKTSKYHKPDDADANVNAIIHAVSVHGGPQSFKQAMASVHQDEWWKAMETEYNGLIAQGTRELCDLPKDRKAIKCRWVFALKLDDQGEVDRFKARLG